MKPRTRSAFAPTYVVDTRTIAMSLRGYCRTVSARMDCRPAIRITRLTTIARTGRLTNRSVNRILAVLRLRRLLVIRLNLVVDENGSAVAKFKDSGSHDLFTRLDTGKYRDLIAAGGSQLDKLLAHTAVRVPVRIFKVFDDEYGIPVGRVADRGCRHGHGQPA